MKLPNSVVIMGIEYSISYVDNPAEVDLYKRKSLWGEIDYWSRTIRIYKNENPVEDVFRNVLHEMLHGIADEYKIKCLKEEENHDDLDQLAGALADTMIRNGWIVLEESEE